MPAEAVNLRAATPAYTHFRNRSGSMGKTGETGGNGSLHRGSLDRMEGDVAVIILDDGRRILLPIGVLPPEAAEGDVIDISIRIDREESASRLSRLESIREELLRRGGEDDGEPAP